LPIFRSKVAVEDARAASGIGITAGCALGLRKWPQLEIPRVIPLHAARTRGQEQPHLEEAMMQELVSTRRHWFAALTMALGIAV